MANRRDHLLALGALSLSLLAGHAHAHFKLLKPASWLNEEPDGSPQKSPPCGVAASQEATAPKSGAVTEFHVGDKVTVEWVDTIAHPGHFRIALAKNRADLKNPDIAQGDDCSYDESKVPTAAQGNVLADGLFFRSRVGFSDPAGKMFSHEITLPSEPCDDCTLQVMQVMENDLKFISQCYYFHCANIRILAANEPIHNAGTGGSAGGGGGSAGGAGEPGTAGTTGSDAGSGATGDSAVAGMTGGVGLGGSAGAAAASGGSSGDSGGCSVSGVHGTRSGSALVLCAAALLFGLRSGPRSRRQRA